MECSSGTSNSERIESLQESYYCDLYKHNNIFNNQLDRRNKLLIDLKRRRHDQIDEIRGIAEIFNSSDVEEEPDDVIEHRKRKFKNYGRKIMLSEWLTEVPIDLEEMWLFKVCPIGVRNIVVANKGITKAYNRKNKLKAIFQSSLPGGNHANSHNFTLLDCVYRDKEKTYYVLDVLVWNSYSLLKCSSDFRFFFLKSKLLEDPELSSPSSKVKFLNIDYHEALLPTVETHFMDTYVVNEVELPVDGILFYHKHCIYMSGFTPLVGWLKPYMIPEKLRIPIHESYITHRPGNYINLETYLNNVKIKYNKKRKGTNREEFEAINMDIGHIEDSEIDTMS